MADLTQRPRVFLDVQSGPEHFGRIVVELFADKAPKTCEKYSNPTLCSKLPYFQQSIASVQYAHPPLHHLPLRSR